MTHMNRRTAASALIPVLALSSFVAACGEDNAPPGASVRVVLQADVSQVTDSDANAALEAAADIVEHRVDAYGATAKVHREGANRLSVELVGIEAADAQELTGQRGLLEFRQPKLDRDGNVVVCEGGTVIYDPPGCAGGQETVVSPHSLVAQIGPEDIIWLQPTVSPGSVLPEAAAEPFIRVPATVSPGGPMDFSWVWATVSPDSLVPETPAESIVWTPALAVDGGGQQTVLAGRFLKPNTFLAMHPITGEPQLQFEMTDEGSKMLEQVTERLLDLPLAFFLDGEPVRGEDGTMIAPIVRAVISDKGAIDGLAADDTRMLSIVLNSGPLPVPLQVIEVEELGE